LSDHGVPQRPGFVTSAVKRGATLIKITDVTGHRRDRPPQPWNAQDL